MAKKNLKNKVDWYIVNRVKEKRILENLTQEDIALQLNVSTGFIGHVESPNFRAKYNATHLNELAKLFKCSIKDFLPETPL